MVGELRAVGSRSRCRFGMYRLCTKEKRKANGTGSAIRDHRRLDEPGPHLRLVGMSE